MRVALVQLRLDQPSRSARIQAILSGLRRAVDVEVAPDLVVLPGDCDGNADESCAARRLVSEAIAHEAREWGVFIAAGLHDESGPQALLFDADGDVAARSRHGRRAEREPEEAGFAFYNSPYGAMGVVEPSLTTLAQVDASKLVPELIVAVPVSTNRKKLSAAEKKNMETFLKPKSPEIGAAHWAVVLSAQGKKAKQIARSTLWGPGGSSLASAKGFGEEIVYVDVPFAPAVVR